MNSTDSIMAFLVALGEAQTDNKHSGVPELISAKSFRLCRCRKEVSEISGAFIYLIGNYLQLHGLRLCFKCYLVLRSPIKRGSDVSPLNTSKTDTKF